MEFNVIDEKHEFKLGNIISVFKIPETSREIALFSVGDFDKEDISLNVAYIDTSSDGYDYLSEIDDDEILKKAMEAARDMIEIAK